MHLTCKLLVNHASCSISKFRSYLSFLCIIFLFETIASTFYCLDIDRFGDFLTQGYYYYFQYSQQWDNKKMNFYKQLIQIQKKTLVMVENGWRWGKGSSRDNWTR